MRIIKELRSTHPTVQYGNIDILSRYEYDTETDDLSEETLASYKDADGIIQKLTTRGWTKLHDYIEATQQKRLGRIAHASTPITNTATKGKKKISVAKKRSYT